MGNIRVRPETGNLQLDFYYMGKRCREQTTMKDDRVNRRRLEALMKTIDLEITEGTFRYGQYFPNSRLLPKIQFLEAEKFNALSQAVGGSTSPQFVISNQELSGNKQDVSFVDSPLFEDFAIKYQDESEAVWKRSNIKTKRDIADKWLIPTFKGRVISSITKQDILELRSVLAKAPGKKPGTLLSPSRVNHVMTALKQIVDEAADRFNFTTPFTNIKRLKIKKSDVNPFTLDEVNHIINHCREDFRNYFTVKFFTGMRPAELHGLKWKYVDFQKRLIMVRETIVDDHEETPKTEDSARDIQMTPPVYAALKSQFVQTFKKSKYVFCTSTGGPLTNRNMSNRVWYPMLRSFGLPLRNPYQTRHTYATLMLAAGESPEWIANQMGHSTTEMLFKVYSRYVPNLTRRDGSAFEMLLAATAAKVGLPAPATSPKELVVEVSESKPIKVPADLQVNLPEQAPATPQVTPQATPPIQVEPELNFGKTQIKNPWAEMFESYQSAQESNPQNQG